MGSALFLEEWGERGKGPAKRVGKEDYYGFDPIRWMEYVMLV